MIFNKKKKNRDQLLHDFGKIKDDSFNFELIERYFQNKDQKATFHVLSDKTCKDIDFSELFMYVDRTISRVGQQFLYNKLRTIPVSSTECDAHEKQIAEFSANPNFRVAVQKQLSKLSNSDTFYISSLFQDEHLQAPRWLFIGRILSFTSALALTLILVNPGMLLVLIAVFILNTGIHYWNKRNLNHYLGSLPQLLRLNAVAKELVEYESLKSINPTVLESIKIINKLKNRMSFFRLESKLQGEFQALFWLVLELFKILFLLEPLFLFGVLKQLDSKRKEMEDLFSFVGQIDSIISIASLRQELDCFCIPEISTEQKEMIANDIYHPLIFDCVKNIIHVHKKSILLTGSNMSGKTSFIRTIGINVICGLTLNTCFAERFVMPGLKVFSAIRISDDLMNDKSYYFEEVLTIKEMIDESVAQGPNLFLLDEIFKGTNTIERIAAGKAVLSALTKADNLVFVSTHDIELADLLKEEYELYHFSEKVDDKNVDFDFKLKHGKLKNRNAIRILQINDYPSTIISEAIEISKKLDHLAHNNYQSSVLLTSRT